MKFVTSYILINLQKQVTHEKNPKFSDSVYDFLSPHILTKYTAQQWGCK